jgi:hypothetical protein
MTTALAEISRLARAESTLLRELYRWQGQGVLTVRKMLSLKMEGTEQWTT